MLWLWIGCAHVGIPMPGSTRYLTQRSIEQSEQTEQTQISSVGGDTEIRQSASNQALDNSRGEAIAQQAVGLIGQESLSVYGDSVRYDCSGFIVATHRLSNIELSGNTRSMFEQAQQRSGIFVNNPLAGDVVFFDNTYDRNRNGKLDDALSHIAIVQHVDEDQTVHMVHLGGSGIVSLTMNLAHPADHKDASGKLLNSYLRVNRKGESSPRLTGQLFRGFGRFW